MEAMHLELLVEEQSMEAFLHALLPRLLPPDRTFRVHPFQGKGDLLNKLETRLRGYAMWLPDTSRIIVLVDRDSEDCGNLKRRLEDVAGRAGLLTRARAVDAPWQLVNRIAIEELEAWYFGDWNAVLAAYPRALRNVPGNRRYRDPDGIVGGTWEAFERVMQQRKYFKGGLRKVEAARTIGAYVDGIRSSSRSFQSFCNALIEAVALA